MIQCLIVDDDLHALNLLEEYIQKIPYLSLLGKCKNQAEAIAILNSGKVDLLFMEVRMPGLTGIQLIKSVKPPPFVIFTTAFTEYALQGYELDILDFLLKPFSFERFLKAVSKANEMMQLKHPGLLRNFNYDILFVKTGYKIIKIIIPDILYIEGLKDYVKIFTKEKNPLITLKSMIYFEKKLPPAQFIRVHRSFIVAINKIESISKNRIIIGDKYIPVSLGYKEEFLKVISKYL